MRYIERFGLDGLLDVAIPPSLHERRHVCDFCRCLVNQAEDREMHLAERRRAARQNGMPHKFTNTKLSPPMYAHGAHVGYRLPVDAPSKS